MSTPGEVRAALVANERAELTATYVNGLAIALFAVGGLAPMFAQRSSTLGGEELSPGATLDGCPALTLLLLFPLGALALGLGTLWFARRAQ